MTEITARVQNGGEHRKFWDACEQRTIMSPSFGTNLSVRALEIANSFSDALKVILAGAPQIVMRNVRRTQFLLLFSLVSMLTTPVFAADIPGAKDPPGMKRYEGSEIIGYRAPRFDEFLLPLGTPTSMSPPAYQKSLKVDGLVSRCTYVAPAGRSPGELFRNYKTEFQRLGLEGC